VQDGRELSLESRGADMRRRRESRLGGQLFRRKAAAAAINIDPTMSSFAASGIPGKDERTKPGVVGRATTTEATIELEAEGAMAAVRTLRHAVADSSDRAKPTGTTSAATTAAKNKTRNRFRITSMVTPTRFPVARSRVLSGRPFARARSNFK